MKWEIRLNVIFGVPCTDCTYGRPYVRLLVFSKSSPDWDRSSPIYIYLPLETTMALPHGSIEPMSNFDKLRFCSSYGSIKWLNWTTSKFYKYSKNCREEMLIKLNHLLWAIYFSSLRNCLQNSPPLCPLQQCEVGQVPKRTWEGTFFKSISFSGMGIQTTQTTNLPLVDETNPPPKKWKTITQGPPSKSVLCWK